MVLAAVAAFFAGMVDAMAGGGGLIQLPALFVLMPGEAPATVLGTNKAAAVWGTSLAAYRYGRAVALPWRSIAAAAAAAFFGSGLGALAARTADAAAFKPAVVVVLLLVAAFTFLRPEYGAVARGRERLLLGAALGGALGFYDGILGPGTGTFLIFAFIASLGLDYLGANAGAKVVNVATNLAALLIFAVGGNVRWDWALPMAAANMAGSLVGSSLALRGGSAWVRRVFQLVILALISKVAWDVARSG